MSNTQVLISLQTSSKLRTRTRTKEKKTHKCTPWKHVAVLVFTYIFVCKSWCTLRGTQSTSLYTLATHFFYSYLSTYKYYCCHWNIFLGMTSLVQRHTAHDLTSSNTNLFSLKMQTDITWYTERIHYQLKHHHLIKTSRQAAWSPITSPGTNTNWSRFLPDPHTSKYWKARWTWVLRNSPSSNRGLISLVPGYHTTSINK